MNNNLNFKNRNSYDAKRELMLLFADFANAYAMEDGETKNRMFEQLEHKCRGAADYFSRPVEEIVAELGKQDDEWNSRMEALAKEDENVAKQLKEYREATANLRFLYMR